MKMILLIIKDIKNIGLYFKNMDVRSFIWFIKYPRLVRKMILKLDAKFFTIRGEGRWGTTVFLQKYGLKFYIKDYTNMEVILEIFYNDAYQVNSNSKYTVIDIGMNVGIASLYFAKYINILNIYAFEPFKDLYTQAQDNFNLNKDISHKIIPHNSAVSDVNEQRQAFYFTDRKISSTIYSDVNLPQNHSIKTEIVNVFSIADILKKIKLETESRILLKLDCEGAEYAIFKLLDISGLLDKKERIDLVMLEYHGLSGDAILTEILAKNGFVSFTRKINKDLGMIYSVRSV
ncbi:MAG: FkbM family methyltransferase [Endomicrobium sp.]|jgi:FkbM family methyltransferase|nr:FkbM family methyltransferase [Endomicrobium sp.]